MRRVRGGKTKEERAYHEWLASLPCGVCGATGQTNVHHIREGQGMGQRASHWLAVPLCWDCHQGPQGIHGDRSLWKLRKLDELGVLAAVIEKLAAR